MIIQLMQPQHERAVRRLVMLYLKETFDQDGDFPPTIENAAAFTMHAIQGAAEGDPCLVALDDATQRVIGFVAARGVHFPGLQTRHRTIRSWGTYVLPEFRERGDAVKLITVCGRLAKQRGYTRFLGMTHGTGYEEKAERVVRKIPGMQDVGRVLMMDLTQMDCMVQRAPIELTPEGVLTGGRVVPETPAETAIEADLPALNDPPIYPGEIDAELVQE